MPARFDSLGGDAFRRIFDSIHDAVVVFDPSDETVLLVNDHACRIYRRERENFVGTSLRDFSRDVEFGLDQIRRTILSPEHCHFTTIQYRGDGTELALDVSAVRVDLDGQTAIVSINRDVTDRLNLVRRLRDSSAEWQMTVDSLDIAILLLDGSGRIFRANRYARSLAGEDFFDRTMGELAGSEPWRTMRDLARAATEQRTRTSAEVTDSPPRYGTWYVAVEPAQRADGSDCLVAVATDVTSIVELEASLRRNEAVAEMGRLVGGVAHEVRNPLFVISATCDAIESRWQPADEMSQRHLHNLRTEINRVADLMHDLLEYGKPAALHLSIERVDQLIALAAAEAEHLAREKHVSLELDVASDAGAVDVDRAQVVIALRNLIENAIHHSPANESVTVRARAASSGAVVHVNVEDRGRGFDAADFEKVFEPFFSKRRGGTGLGLSLARRTIELHGGQITAENRGGGGARFTVELSRIEP